MGAATTVSKTEALDVPPEPIVVPASSKTRFIQSNGAGYPVPVGEGRFVVFHVAVDNRTGDRYLGGVLETSDPEEIRALRAHASAGLFNVIEEPAP